MVLKVIVVVLAHCLLNFVTALFLSLVVFFVFFGSLSVTAQVILKPSHCHDVSLTCDVNQESTAEFVANEKVELATKETLVMVFQTPLI